MAFTKKISRKSTKNSKPSPAKIYSREVDRGGMYIGEVDRMLELSADPTFTDSREQVGYAPMNTSPVQVQKIGNERRGADLHMMGYAAKLRGTGMMEVEVGRFLPNGS